MNAMNNGMAHAMNGMGNGMMNMSGQHPPIMAPPQQQQQQQQPQAQPPLTPVSLMKDGKVYSYVAVSH
jgi:hypothetical protein